MENKSSPQLVTPGFKREIGVFGGVSIIAGIMIGSGIFYLGSYVLQRTNFNVGVAILCWVVGGIVSMLGGLCFAELGASKPKAGGMIVYLNDAYHPAAGFLYGFSQWLLASSGSIAAVAIALPTTLLSVMPGLTQWQIKGIAITIIVLLTLYNCLGVKEASILQNISLIAKLLPMAIIMIGALFLGSEKPDLSLSFVGEGGEALNIGGIISMIAFASVASLWAYEGWTNLNSVAEEMKDVKKNLPRALIIGIGGVTLFYVLFNFAIYRVIPVEEAKTMIGNEDLYLGTEVAKRLFGNLGGILVLSGMVIAMFGSLNGMILAFSRIYYAMAQEGHFFKNHGKLSRKGVPVVSLISQCVIAIVLVCLRNLDQLTSMVVFISMFFNVLVVISVFIYRKKEPDLERPYKVWGYPVTVFIAVALFIGLMINNFVEDPVTALVGLVVPAIGVLFYIYFEIRNRKERSSNE